MSPAPARRPAAAPPAPVNRVNFGDELFYVGGGLFDLPEGDYAVYFETVIHTPTKQDGTASGKPSFLAVKATHYPLAGGEPHESILSMGQKPAVLQSFQPTPDGKGLAAVPGGPSTTIGGKTNWGMYRKSLIDSGMPKDALGDSFESIDGVWVHAMSVPEPEDRKSFKKNAATSEVVEEEKDFGPKMIPVVTAILDGGKPWEGTGGMPDATAAPVPAKAAPRAAAPAAARPAPARTAAPAPVAAAAAEPDADLYDIALDAMTSVLAVEANANGCTRVTLRTGTFKTVSTKHGQDVANSVVNTYLNDEAALNGVLGVLGYKAEGGSIKVNQ